MSDKAFYSFFPSDYLNDTIHLEWFEDLAYRRLLDRYYTTAKPLPNDRSLLMRMVRASAPEHQAAVDTVLAEFFELRVDGWHQNKADHEINFRKNKAKKGKEAAELRWNKCKADAKPMPNGILNRIPNRYRNVCQTDAPTPTPTLTPTLTQEPLRSNQSLSLSSNLPEKTEKTEKTENRAGAIAILLRKTQINTSSIRPEVIEWAEQGVPDAVLIEAVDIAKTRKPDEVIGSAYLTHIVANLLNPKPSQQREPPWWSSEQQIEAKARDLKLWPARAGESWQQLKNRIEERLNAESE